MIGGGVVGLAVAAAAARPGRSVVVLERHEAWGRETTSRNSEVVHAGLYYPPGSLKAELCVAGRERLYARCEREGIPHRRLGKLVVACADKERAALGTLLRNGEACGAGALEVLEAEELQRREPSVRGVAALWSPESGIVDGHALCLSLAAEAEAGGVFLALRHRVLGVSVENGSLLELLDPAGAPLTLYAERVVNAAGLEADRLAAMSGVDVAARGMRIHPCKGDYFALAPGVGLELRHLVYPVPVAAGAGAGLGIHATLDLAGRIRFGPDTEYVEAPHYAVDASKAEVFATAIRRYLPGVRAESLTPDYAGVRPKLAGPGEGFRDFYIGEASGSPGWVHLIGIESPGLTAALAIGVRVAGLLA